MTAALKMVTKANDSCFKEQPMTAALKMITTAYDSCFKDDYNSQWRWFKDDYNSLWQLL